MIDRLIASYRAQVYDWTFSRWWIFIKTKKKYVATFVISISILIAMFLCSVKLQSAPIMLLTLFVEAGAFVALDRYAVKHHQIFLRNRKNHLEKTIAFLHDTIPNMDLYYPKVIDELIARLSDRIEAKIPFKNFLRGIDSFSKAVILPVITYIAGAYAGGLKEISLDVVATYGVLVVLMLGIARLTWGGISEILRTVLCRDYDAAIALREDLLDIKFLYFSSGSNSPPKQSVSED